MANRIQEPLVMNKLTLKNRLVMPPMATYIAEEGGAVTDDLCKHYEARLEGGHIGLVITEHACVNAQGRANPRMLTLESDDVVPGLTELVRRIHAFDTPVFAQLNHAGAATTRDISGREVISASAVKLPSIAKVPAQEEPRAMTEAEIHSLIEDYCAAARRAKEAGYDGVEIHSAHAYLLNQFYSPLTNHREDAYGGSLENRLRLHIEIVRAVRETVGSEYPIALRLGACDHCEGGNGISEAVEAARLLEAAGVDVLDISGGMCRFTLEGHDEPGYFGEESAAIKAAVSIPVIVAGGVKTLDQAEDLLEKDVADLVGVGRALLQDPLWAVKAFSKH